MPKLLVRHPDKGEMIFPLCADRISVGRDEDNAIRIDHRTVSGHHAELLAVNGHYIIRDLNSTNHCLVDGEILAEAELNRACRVVLGTVECAYLPDAAEADPEQVDILRKTVGLLRQQNDELIAKISELQRQIQILGHSRLFTATTGADLASLREQVKSQAAERDQLAAENETLRNEFEQLRALIAAGGDLQTIKETLAVRFDGRPRGRTGEVAPAPGGNREGIAPNGASAVPSPNPAYEKLTELNLTLQSLVSRLTWEPSQHEAACDLLLVASQLAEASQPLGLHPIARIAGDIYPLVHGATLRPGPFDRGLLQTISHASGFLAEALKDDALPKLRDLSSPRIVAVDDDSELLSLIVASLEVASLPTIGCSNARDALSTLQETRCDLILLDVGLPDLNGIDMCECIRALPKHDRTPIVFLSAQDTAENRSRGLLRGACDFIGKPCNMIELTLRLHTWALKNQLAAA